MAPPLVGAQRRLEELHTRIRWLKDGGGRPPLSRQKLEGLTGRRRPLLPKLKNAPGGTFPKAVQQHGTQHSVPAATTAGVSSLLKTKPFAPGAGEASTPMCDDRSKPQPPFTEEEFERLSLAFKELDVDGGGDLTMKEVSRIPEIVGRKDLVIDRTMFKKMDKDRSGTVDFIEMLRCLYPTAPSNAIKAAVSKYSVPSERKRREKDVKDEAKDWRKVFRAEDIEELQCIFHLYGEQASPGVFGITKRSLQRQLPTTAVSDDTIDDIFEQYATVLGQPLTAPLAAPVVPRRVSTIHIEAGADVPDGVNSDAAGFSALSDDGLPAAPAEASDSNAAAGDDDKDACDGDDDGGVGGGGDGAEQEEKERSRLHLNLASPAVAAKRVSGDGDWGTPSSCGGGGGGGPSAVPPYISLDSFAGIMELTYTSDEKNSKAPLLYFQKKTDGPTYPLSLPRV